MKQELINAHAELQQIFVRGIDAIHMTNALLLIEQIIQTLPDEPEKDAKEEG